MLIYVRGSLWLCFSLFTHLSSLFFVVVVHPPSVFTLLLLKGIDNAAAAEGLAHVGELKKCLRYTIFQWVARGIFEKHKLLYLAQLAFSLMRRGELGEEFNHTAFNLYVTF